jgi:hypothetical protein
MLQSFNEGVAAMPGTPHDPMIARFDETIGKPAGPVIRDGAGDVLSSFLQRLALDVENMMFSTVRAQAACPKTTSAGMPRYHFHYLVKTLLEDDVGQRFPSAAAALAHAECLAVQLSAGENLPGSTILVASNDTVIFEVPLQRRLNS